MCREASHGKSSIFFGHNRFWPIEPISRVEHYRSITLTRMFVCFRGINSSIDSNINISINWSIA